MRSRQRGITICLILILLTNAQNNATDNNATSSSVPTALLSSSAPSSMTTPIESSSDAPSTLLSNSPSDSNSSFPSLPPSKSVVPSLDPTGTLAPEPPSPLPTSSFQPSQWPTTSHPPSQSNQPSGSSAPSQQPSTSPSEPPSLQPSVSNRPSGSSPPSTTPSWAPTRANFTHAGTCRGYIETQFEYSNLTGPHPIWCDNQTFSRWGPPEHQASACCTDEGRYRVQLAETGGFDILYKGNQASGVGVPYRCIAYTEALRATLCDPLQGANVVVTPETGDSYFRICKSSCDAVFIECGLPGVNYPDAAQYTDGTSMCYAAWGGWDSGSCDEQGKNNFPCTLTGLEVYDDTLEAAVTLPSNELSTCQAIVYPTDATLEVYKETRQPPDACTPDEPSTIGIFIVVIVVVLVSLSVCGMLIYLHARHRQAEEDFS